MIFFQFTSKNFASLRLRVLALNYFRKILLLKKSALSVVLFCVSAVICLAQTPVEASKPVQSQPTNSLEISENEWKILTDALGTEDWEKAAFFASLLLSRTKADNEKKQLARLRYFYLYALAGKILETSDAKQTIKKEATRKELEKAVETFIGKEFLLPPRQFLSDCEQRVNYICPVKDNEKALRVTATNKDATAILSFDYVLFDTKVDLNELTAKQAFLGGTLKKVEFNDDISKPWVMRLIFEKGFARVVIGH